METGFPFAFLGNITVPLLFKIPCVDKHERQYEKSLKSLYKKKHSGISWIQFPLQETKHKDEWVHGSKLG